MNIAGYRNEADRLFGVQLRLEAIARAAYTMGNRKLAQKLRLIGEEAQTSAKNIQKLVSDDLNRELMTSGQLHSAAIQAALAGATLVRRADGEVQAMKRLLDKPALREDPSKEKTHACEKKKKVGRKF